MTKRFVLVLLIAFGVPLVLPNVASAQTQNKLVFEIKISDLVKFLEQEPEYEVVTEVEPLGPFPPVTKVATKRTAYVFPPKVTGDARVFMTENEIRAYVCPKLSDKCNIFIAVLKAENGTHECTRDNRGLNRNGSVDIGLAQINWKPGYPHSFEALQDCKYNLDIAISMYQRRGFQPWYAYTKGTYRKHLPAVLASAKLIEQAVIEPITN